MRVLIASDTYKPVVNGVVTSVVNLENELIKQGHEVLIVTLAQSDKSYEEGNVIYLGSRDIENVYPNARIRFIIPTEWVEKVVEWKPDIIHTQNEFTTFRFARMVSKKLHIPIVHTYHTAYEDYTHYFAPTQRVGQEAVKIIARSFCKKVDHMITPSEKTESGLRSYGVTVPISVVPSGIVMHDNHFDKMTVRTQLDISEDEIVLLYVGRLGVEKNLDELFDFLEDYEGTHMTFLVVGDGPHKRILEKVAKHVSTNIKVIFAGMIEPERVPAYYRAADLFVSASTSETQGLTYIEAAASGLPLLCKKDPCLNGVIDGNGWKYETREEFMTYLHEFLQMDSECRQAMGARSVEMVEKFDLQSTTSQILQVYREAIDHFGKEDNRWNIEKLIHIKRTTEN